MTRFSLFCALPLLCVCSASVAIGQLTAEVRAGLVGEIESASARLDAGQLPDLTSASAALLLRAEALEPFLDSVTDPANRDAWLRYLNVSPLVMAIESDASASERAKESMALRDRLVGTTPGLEMSAVLGLRDAIDQYVDALLFRNRDQSIEMLRKQLRSLAEMISKAQDCPSASEFSAISARVGLLESSRQSPELVQTFRDTFNRPNAAIMIAASLVEDAINRPVERTRPVRDCILGTRLIGSATMTGHVRASLLPSSDSAKVHLTFVGRLISNSRGFNGPVRLQTVSDGDVNATRTMTVDASGIEFGDTTSDAMLKTRIKCIENRLAIVRAIARKQAAKQKPLADRIALNKLREQVKDQFASETSHVTPVTPTELLARAEPMLHRLALTMPSQHWSSSENAIFVDALFRAPGQLSSVVPRPSVSQPYEVAMQIHESAIENAFSVMLAGRTLDEKRLNELLERVGQIPSSDDDDSEPPFEISFSRSRPVIFEARDKSLRIGLRGTRFVQGKRAPLTKAMEITAVYEAVVKDDGRVALQRSGDVDVDFPRQRLTLSEVSLKPIIQKEFSEIFPPEILDQSLRIRDDAKIETLRGREFHPSLIQAVDGWLTIAFQ